MIVQAQAHIVDGKVVWLQPPQCPVPPETPVLLVWESGSGPKESTARPPAAGGVDISDLAGRLRWQGDAAAQQRTQRDAW